MNNRRASHILFISLILIVAAGGLALRLPRLAQRPMHTDEAVHAVKFGVLYDTGRYVYNPREFHGPTLYYFSLPIVWLSGARSYAEIRNENPLRLTPVLFGAGLIALVLLVSDGIGRVAAVCAAVLTAVSPAMAFFSRQYVQEMLLAFFTFCLIAAAWRYARAKRLGWALAAGAFIGLMHATKETAILAWGAMIAAVALERIWGRWRDKAPASEESATPAAQARPPINWRHLLGALAVAATVSILLMSVCFRNPRAILDSILAYGYYFGRGCADMERSDGAAYHVYHWREYLETLLFVQFGNGPWWTEAMIVVLAVVGLDVALFRPAAGGADVRLLRFLAFYTVVLTTVYSAIPYKTPWCILGFLHGMILLAGVGAAALIRWARRWPLKAVVCAALIAGAAHLAAQARKACFVFYADVRNPYVYSQTLPDVVRLAGRMEDLAGVSADGYHTLVKVVAPGSDYWPLPWYLRRFDRVGYWDEPCADCDAPIIIAKVGAQPDLDARLRGAYQVEFYGLRPQELLAVYIEKDLWDEFLRARSKE